jgi:hypothetical protein
MDLTTGLYISDDVAAQLVQEPASFDSCEIGSGKTFFAPRHFSGARSRGATVD